jgi:ubiquinone/menaquinone biosynthesis C-methylase UbiE
MTYKPYLGDAATIPMTRCQFGSWHFAISRRPKNKVDLADDYDVASRRWARTAQHYCLDAAYRAPLITSGVAGHLAQVGPLAKVLDCGIGSGCLSVALNGVMPCPPEFHGIDLSRDMLDVAGDHMRKAGLAPKLKHADILSLPYPDQTFDLVMAAHVIEHLPDPQPALAEMVRVLKPGGMMFVCITRRSFFGALIQVRWRTWAVTEQQGTGWLAACDLEQIGAQSVKLGLRAGHASTAFWAQRPTQAECVR